MSLPDFKAFAQEILGSFQLESFPEIQLSERALIFLSQELRDEFEDLNQLCTRTSRHSHFQIPGSSPEDFSEHLVELDEHKNILCGIRHKGGNPDLPFVRIQTDFPCSQDEILSLYSSHLKNRFAVFKPQFLQVFDKKPLLNSQTGILTLAASKAKILNSSSEKCRLQLKPVQDDYYPRYMKSYAEFHASHPELKDRVPRNSFEEMAECRKQGLLYSIFYEEEHAGWIAAQLSPFLGHPGFYITEIFLLPLFRGKGLASAIQREFIRTCAPNTSIIWGTIDACNPSSLKTALSNGREIVRREVFVSILDEAPSHS